MVAVMKMGGGMTKMYSEGSKNGNGKNMSGDG